MSRPALKIALLMLPLLAACGGPAPGDDAGANASAAAAGPKSIKIRNKGQEQLLALNDTDRAITLRRAVRDDGGRCPKIRGSKYQEEYKSTAMWVAHCSSEDYAVFVSPSETVQARPCKHAGQIGFPACKPWPADPAEAGAAPPLWPEIKPAPPTNSQATSR